MKHRFECPFVNVRGERHIVVVDLSAAEAADACLNPHVFLNVARAHAARRALQHLPAGFTAFDLRPDQIRGHSVH